jgi:CheY-like chemotaxis protein
LKLEEISIGMITQALDLYIKVAFSGLPPKVPPPSFGSNYSESIEPYLGRFEDESTIAEGVKLRRFILRIGNMKYPFMKFVIQEHLIQDEFILLVDTHDDMFDIPTSDFEDLRRIREFNREIKLQIESLWSERNLPTLASLKKLVAGIGGRQSEKESREFKNMTILVVDDDPVMGDTLEELLKSRGFSVERLYDGIDAVREADPLRHDMIIMDNDMKIMDGQEACRILKEDPIRCAIPIMIASARNVDISIINKADAYLVKPFHQDILFSFIRHIMKKKD